MRWVGFTQYAIDGKGGGVHRVRIKSAIPSIDKKNPLSDFENIQWSEGRVEFEPISKIADHAQEQGSGRRKSAAYI
jgi:hypothetical protein